MNPSTSPELAEGTPPTGPAPARRRPSGQVRVALALALALLGAALYLTGGGSATAGAGEIFLEAADSPGPDAFTPSIAAPPAPPTVPAAAPTPVAPAPVPQRPGSLTRTSAATPGLYAGTRNSPGCDAPALVGFLEADRRRARAWAAAVGVDRSEIGAYVAALTPVALRADVRVSDYGFAAGRAVARQAVVQAGTAVLVDRLGHPRVRCASGNPLGEPRAVPVAPRYAGARWPGFSPASLVVITPAARTNPVVILVDPATGLVFGRIPGSVVIIDIDPPGPDPVVLVVEPGQAATVTGSRWPPGTAVVVRFDDPAAELTTVVADGAGALAAAIVIPDAAPAGAHQITMAGVPTTITQTLYVIPRAPVVRLVPGPRP